MGGGVRCGTETAGRGRDGGAVEQRRQVAADHQADDLPLRGVLDGPYVHEAPVPQDGDAVGEPEDLLEPMRDVDHRRPLRAHDLDELPLRGREGGAEGGGVEEVVEAEPQEVVTDPGVEGGPVEEAPPAPGKRAGVDVLGDGHVGDDLGLLADDADAVAARVGGERRSRGWSSRRTRPRSGRWSPFRILMRVDFPAPFSPMSALTRPGGKSRVTSRRAWTPENRLDSDRTLST
ncbi:hypothetical protein GCM10009560_37430 [Nonomuraea longicatena]|uniref:Uncharacterized protein n=1 Tax=Nonomuraea longicatena TaxID=83682 RepID=A0ABP4A606_9ACTN